MQTKAPLPLGSLSGRGASALIEAYFEFSHLKQLYRQGWLRRGIPPERCESVAEHSFGVALLCLFLTDSAFPQLDQSAVVRMALLHDLGEIYAGDITPSDAVTADEKHRLEAAAVERVVGKLPGGERYLAAWQAYEDGSTPEARLVKQVDRLEMGLQAGVYEAQGLARLDEFYASARAALSDPALLALMDELEALRTGPGRPAAGGD